SQSTGTLGLTTNSTIELASGSHILQFNGTTGTWTAGQTVSISGWSGTPGSTGTAGRIINGGTALTTAELNQINFTNYGPGATQLSGGEIVPRIVYLDFLNLQFPATATITVGGTTTVYAQVYKAGLTDLPGQAAGITAWIGYSSTDTDPSTWTNWVPASFNTQAGNNDEYQATFGAALPIGTYYYASRFFINGGIYQYGGYSSTGGGEWETAINTSGILTVNDNTVDFCNLQSPYAGSILRGGGHIVYARVYELGVTEAPGQGAGISAWIGYSTTETNPNTGTWTWIPATFTAQTGNDDEYSVDLGAVLASVGSGSYNYVSRFRIGTGSFSYGGITPGGSGGNFWNGTNYINGRLDIADVKGNGLLVAYGGSSTSATNNTAFGTGCVNAPIDKTFTISNTSATHTLSFLNVSIAGTNAADFSVQTAPTSPIPLSGSTSFVVRFTPTAAGARTAVVNVNTDALSYSFAVSGTGTANATPTVSIASAPAAITGTTTICAGTNVVFTATAANTGGGTVAYQWKLNGGDVGTNASTYSNNALANGNIVACVITVTGACVTSTTAASNNITMVVNSLPPNDVCGSASPLTINAAISNGGMQCATSTAPFAGKDVWYRFTPGCNGDHVITVSGFSGDIDIELFSGATCPSSATFLAQSNTSTPTETITYDVSASTIYYIRVLAFNVAAENSTFTINVAGTTTVPTQPSAITGPTSICQASSNTYSVVAVSGATGYTWGLPDVSWSGSSITETLTATAGLTSGNITVTANNGCGAGPAQTILITVLPTPANPLASSATNILGTSFTSNWNAVGGASGYYVDVYTSAGILEDFTDGDFTGNPTWTGNTGSFGVQTAATLPAGTATTDGSYLASNSAVGHSTLMSASNEVEEWKFSLASTSFGPSSANYIGVILMSNNPITGDVAAANFNGYYLRIGTNGNPDRVELWRSTATAKTQIGDFSTGDYDGAALTNGLNIRVTRSVTGIFELFYSTGFTYLTAPTTTGGTLSSNTHTSSSYFGVFQHIENPNASRRVYMDNIILGNKTFVPGYENVFAASNSLEVFDLTPATNYCYVVRSTNGNCISTSSNEICVTTTTCASAIHTVSGILPITGPARTWITINGSGFNNITKIKVGNVDITNYTVLNSSTITAQIPIDAETGVINVYNDGCPKSSATFTLLTNNGNCAGSSSTVASNLFISEVFDSENGSRSYIELYNGTNAAISLTTYSLKIFTGATSTVSLSGTIAAGGTVVVRIGSAGTDCPGFTYINRSDLPGFNEDDIIELYKGSTKIDRVETPNNAGYSMIRNTTTNVPSLTYLPGQWNISNTVDTKYMIGSVSKPITATLVLIQVQKGLLSLDKTLADYLPEFEKYGKKRFVNPVYEGKRTEWKQGFRAGKEVTESARAFAQKWLSELK
ncbi:MAG: choice-of-anchor D domain-containing protein, partial [Sphingobacteriales bacterium]